MIDPHRMLLSLSAKACKGLKTGGVVPEKLLQRLPPCYWMMRLANFSVTAINALKGFGSIIYQTPLTFEFIEHTVRH